MSTSSRLLKTLHWLPFYGVLSLSFAILAVLFFEPGCLAVRVNNLGTEEEEMNAIEQHEPVRVIAPCKHDRCCCTRLEVDVVAAIDGKPVGGVGVYLKSVAGQDITYVHSSCLDATILIGSIAGTDRVIYARDRAGNCVKQHLSLKEGQIHHTCITMPYDALITVALPASQKGISHYAYALAKVDNLQKTETAEFSGTYDADTRFNQIRLPVPSGTYRVNIDDSEGLYSSAFGRDDRSKGEGRFERVVTVRSGQRLTLRLQDMHWRRVDWMAKKRATTGGETESIKPRTSGGKSSSRHRRSASYQ